MELEPKHLVERPRGLKLFLFRLPAWLYRLGLGRWIGERFILIHHVGRHSGKQYQSVVEVVRHDRDQFMVMSAYGEQADWYQNVMAESRVDIQVGGRSFEAQVLRLSAEVAEQEMLDYVRRYPRTATELIRLIGFDIEPTEDGFRELAAYVPFLVFQINS